MTFHWCSASMRAAIRSSGPSPALGSVNLSAARMNSCPGFTRNLIRSSSRIGSGASPALNAGGRAEAVTSRRWSALAPSSWDRSKPHAPATPRRPSRKLVSLNACSGWSVMIPRIPAAPTISSSVSISSAMGTAGGYSALVRRSRPE